MRHSKRLIGTAVAATMAGVCAASCLGCSQPGESRQLYAMDTVMTLTVWSDSAEELLDAAEKEINSLQLLFDPDDDNSEVWAINHTEGQVLLSSDMAQVLDTAQRVSRLTDGAFDVTIGAVTRAWGLRSGEYRVPSGEELTSLLETVGSDRLKVNGSVLRRREGTEIELGGIAKGYASQKIATMLREAGVSSAIIDLGGNIQVLGSKPDGSAYRIAVTDPFDTQAYIGYLDLRDTAVVTSGSYLRNFTLDGVFYHHIIDPKTGSPADSGLAAVSVVCEDAALADGLSTALFVMGREESLALYESGDVAFEALFVQSDGTVSVTPGLAQCYHDLSGSGFTVCG